MNSKKWIFKEDIRDLADIKAHEEMLGGTPVIEKVTGGHVISVEYYNPMKSDQVMTHGE
jgi:hypothetical protein